MLICSPNGRNSEREGAERCCQPRAVSQGPAATVPLRSLDHGCRLRQRHCSLPPKCNSPWFQTRLSSARSFLNVPQSIAGLQTSSQEGAADSRGNENTQENFTFFPLSLPGTITKITTILTKAKCGFLLEAGCLWLISPMVLDNVFYFLCFSLLICKMGMKTIVPTS